MKDTLKDKETLKIAILVSDLYTRLALPDPPVTNLSCNSNKNSSFFWKYYVCFYISLSWRCYSKGDLHSQEEEWYSKK